MGRWEGSHARVCAGVLPELAGYNVRVSTGSMVHQLGQSRGMQHAVCVRLCRAAKHAPLPRMPPPPPLATGLTTPCNGGHVHLWRPFGMCHCTDPPRPLTAGFTMQRGSCTTVTRLACTTAPIRTSTPPPPFRFDHATGVMYTCDAFGMHYCTDQPYDVDIKAIMPHYR